MSKQLNENNNQKFINQIISWICEEGKNKAQVKNLIIANSPTSINEQQAYELLQQAIDKLTQDYTEENDPIKIINQHIAWYEHIYAYFRSKKHASGALKAMQAKERLLNILKEGNKMTFKKSETTIHTTSGVIEYDESRLNDSERDRLRYLLAKASNK